MLPKLKDMARTREEMIKDNNAYPVSIGDQSIYPYGLCLSLDNETLDKLDLDGDCEPGDFIHLFALCKVTSVSKNDTGDGMKCRIELQITHAGVESEDEENEEEDKKIRPRPRYKE
jgi:hypothetical protein